LVRLLHDRLLIIVDSGWLMVVSNLKILKNSILLNSINYQLTTINQDISRWVLVVGTSLEYVSVFVYVRALADHRLFLFKIQRLRFKVYTPRHYERSEAIF